MVGPGARAGRRPSARRSQKSRERNPEQGAPKAREDIGRGRKTCRSGKWEERG